jgi:hypothetical protein
MIKPALVFILLVSGCINVPAGAATDAAPTIAAIAAEFQNLRAIQGHFSGADWNDDVDQWMGRKHQLMIQLGSQLGAGEYDAAQVIQWLGSPDQSAGPGDDVYELVSNLHEFDKPEADSYEFLIYHWRGGHDFLYFTAQGGSIVSSGWWYAGE